LRILGLLIFLGSAQLKAQTAYNGYLDYAGCGSISGWALDWNRLETSITVNIYSDNQILVASGVLASNYRPDLNTGGDAQSHNKGFVIGTPAFLLDGHSHQIYAQYESSGINLFNTPITLECHAYNGYLDTVNGTIISGWALDWNQIETPITVDIYDGQNQTPVRSGVLATNLRSDLATGGDTQSQMHGFSIQTPPVFLDGNNHTVNVVFGRSQLPLSK